VVYISYACLAWVLSKGGSWCDVLGGVSEQGEGRLEDYTLNAEGLLEAVLRRQTMAGRTRKGEGHCCTPGIDCKLPFRLC
jgi:hypothetical protein